MPIPTTPEYQKEKNRLEVISTYLYKIQVNKNPVTYILLTEFNYPILFLTIEQWQLLIPMQQYTPFPISHDKKSASNEFQFSDVQISIASIDQTIVDYVKAHDLLGNNIYIFHVFLQGTNNQYTIAGQVQDAINYNTRTVGSYMQERYIINNITYDEKRLNATATPANFQNAEVPGRRYLQDFCQWVFGSKECGYGWVNGQPPSKNVLEAFPCDHRLLTTEGCVEHGKKNQPIHPMRFGGFPGVANAH